MRQERSAAVTRTWPLTSANIEDAAHLVEHGCLESELPRSQVVAGCRRLLAAGSMTGVLIDVAHAWSHNRVVGIGGGAFVSAAFLAAERTHARPGLTERVLHAALNNHPVNLERRQIEAANAAEGLGYVVMFHHWLPSEPDDAQAEIRRQLLLRFLDDLRGYRLVEILTEGLVAHLPWAVAGGFRLRSDYADWYRHHAEPQPQRCLLGVTRDEALAAEGCTMSMLFAHTPPRLGLTAAQRRLLGYALQHKTDAEIAAALGVSLSAVKKTWAGIFDKVSGAFESMQRSSRSGRSRNERATRGAQKRHTLLTYLREHPEELRP